MLNTIKFSIYAACYFFDPVSTRKLKVIHYTYKSLNIFAVLYPNQNLTKLKSKCSLLYIKFFVCVPHNINIRVLGSDLFQNKPRNEKLIPASQHQAAECNSNWISCKSRIEEKIKSNTKRGCLVNCLLVTTYILFNQSCSRSCKRSCKRVFEAPFTLWNSIYSTMSIRPWVLYEKHMLSQ